MFQIVERVFAFLRQKLVYVAMITVFALLFLFRDIADVAAGGQPTVSGLSISDIFSYIVIFALSGGIIYFIFKGNNTYVKYLLYILLGSVHLGTMLRNLSYIEGVGLHFDSGNVAIGIGYIFFFLAGLAFVGLLTVIALYMFKCKYEFLDTFAYLFMGAIALLSFIAIILVSTQTKAGVAYIILAGFADIITPFLLLPLCQKVEE